MKIGLLGESLVGKDTFFKLLKKNFKSLNFQQIRIAEPLYSIQNFIYDFCNVKIDYYQQDIELLSFLGKHIRLISPNFLEENFKKRISKKGGIIICTDVRYTDIEYLKYLGFIIIHIVAKSSIIMKRKIKRGDLTYTNINLKSTNIKKPNYKIENNCSMIDYEKTVINIFNIIHDSYRQRNTIIHKEKVH